ncbi:unnamed protein product [Vicia faba]|uniref:Uncharacterized protein n=1 Tax=Vicia faba TaxID=3906 RepID=A0AAV0YZ18_VICFA|nr:unnamed protein product [Vicia faba]
MEHENNKKFGSFSEMEIDIAEQLIQLSNSNGETQSGTTYLDENRHSHSYSSNSVTLQWKLEECKGSDDISPSSPGGDSVEDVLAEIEEDEGLRRKKKRIRYIEELYRVTDPIVVVAPFDKN